MSLEGRVDLRGELKGHPHGNRGERSDQAVNGRIPWQGGFSTEAPVVGIEGDEVTLRHDCHCERRSFDH